MEAGLPAPGALVGIRIVREEKLDDRHISSLDGVVKS